MCAVKAKLTMHCTFFIFSTADNPVSEMEDYRVEVCIALRKLERLDKDEFSEDERADAEEVK